MKKAVIFSLVLLILAISTKVEGKKKKPLGRPTSPPKMGWRFGNGHCVCKGLTIHPTAGHHPTGPHGPSRHHPSHPQGHHPTGPHGSPRPHGPHGNHPMGPHGPQRPHGHHGNGPHGPHHRRPPTGRPNDNHHRKRQRGPHNRGPTRKQEKKVWRKCFCRKPADKKFQIKFRMMKQWRPELANRKTEAYRRLAYLIIKKLVKVLKTKMESIHNMRFTKGSIVAEFEVKNSEVTKDPEKALRHAIHKGQLSDLKIQSESLAVHQSYSGVKLSEWKTDEAECDRCGSVTQTRECTEVTASCDGIPLTRNASCYEACPRSRITKCGGFRGSRMAKVMIIACFIIVGVIVIVTVLVVTKVKRARRKYLKTSPSTSSIKKLADDDKLDKAQSKC